MATVKVVVGEPQYQITVSELEAKQLLVFITTLDQGQLDELYRELKNALGTSGSNEGTVFNSATQEELFALRVELK